MKTLSAAMQTHVAQSTTSLCRIVLMLTRWRQVSISGITQANPAVVTTSEEHALETGAYVSLQDVAGMTEINDMATSGWKQSIITVLTPTTFSLDDIDSTAYSAYTSGGKILLCFGWTDLDVDLTYEGMLYRAEASYTPSSTKTGNTMAPDSVELDGILDENYFALPNISEGHIRYGLYDYAEIRFCKVNYLNPESVIWMMRGFTGDFSLTSDGRYRTEVRSLWRTAGRNFLDYYSKSCRWSSISDPRCGVTVASFTESDNVGTIYSQSSFDNAVGGYTGLPLVNPSFETGDYTGWTAYYSCQVNTSGYGGASVPDGTYCAYLYAYGTSGYAYQDVDVSAWATAIDAGNARMQTTGYYTGDGSDALQMQLHFYDSGMSLISTSVGPDFITSGAFLYGERNDVVVPANTRTVRYYLLGKRYAGSFGNVNADAMTLGIKDVSSSGGSGTLWADGYFTGGELLWTSGDNSGLRQQVLDYSSGTWTLWNPAPFDIQAGDGFVVVAGCDKTLDTCHTKFNNRINHGGFPHVPGQDILVQVYQPKKAEVSQ